MASTLMESIREGELGVGIYRRTTVTANQNHAVVVGDHLRRIAAKEVWKSQSKGYNQRVSSADVIRRVTSIIERERRRLDQSLVVAHHTSDSPGHVYHLTLPTTSLGWWDEHLRLQPTCSPNETFDDGYLSILHQTLFDQGTVDEEESGQSRKTIDPVICLTRYISKFTYLPTVIVDEMDRSILIALLELQRRMTTSSIHPQSPSSLQPHLEERGMVGDVFVSPLTCPTMGVSAQYLRRNIQSRYSLYSEIAWENFLLLLPLSINCGIPPLSMLQAYYGNNQLDLLTNIIAPISLPILVKERCVEEEGVIPQSTYSFDVVPLLEVFRKLKSREKHQLQLIEKACEGRTNERGSRDVIGADQVGKGQYKYGYYRLPISSNRVEMIQRIVVTYLSALLQLASIYRGEVCEHILSSYIRLIDAPLAEDVVQVLEEISRRSRYITLPSDVAFYQSTLPSTPTSTPSPTPSPTPSTSPPPSNTKGRRRTFGRIRPLILERFY